MQNLASYAAHEQHSKGRQFSEPHPGFRSEYQRDRDRIVHSTAFRRLEYKTQVFVNHEGDLFRTRLTHSIEVAQIGRAIARVLSLNEDLTEAIALAHDLGHTPFGHAGQDALNDSMKQYGGFEHNLQSLRVVDQLEQKYADFEGLNLTFETREGILKHCSQTNAKQLGNLGERFLLGKQPGLEAQLANFADEIAYNNHDVDDGLRSKLITPTQLREIELFRRHYDAVVSRYPDVSERRTIHETVRRMINEVVNDLVATTSQNLRDCAPLNIDDVRNAKQPLVGFSPAIREQTQLLKRFLRHNLYSHYRVYRMTTKAKHIVQSLFTALMDDIHLLPHEHQRLANQAEQQQGRDGRARVVADYIAGMTDRYAIKEYQRLFEPLQLT
ncbi:MAG: deoxyguanosinetriphosphate triphosphohydrolase [Gammaproteobacteria bacterium]|nr:deoxyguanosinetriphosphate triphosphohydrolase [Gammaproteobacteria bacterium]